VCGDENAEGHGHPDTEGMKPRREAPGIFAGASSVSSDGSQEEARMRAARLPAAAGVGFKPQHFDDILAAHQPRGFFEVHAAHAQLTKLRERYALSIHGVGLSIGSPQPLDRTHLLRLKALCDRYQPESFSEHLAWSSHDDVFFNDLLPLPYTEATLAHVSGHVGEVQDVLGRQMLLENPSTYLQFAESSIPEVEFLREIANRSGCGLLLDVNNVFVQSRNHGTAAGEYLRQFPFDRVGEIHLGGHDEQADDAGAPLVIDAHGAPVVEPVWTLYAQVIGRAGPVATLIEWDNEVPAWTVLLGEAERAGRVLDRARQASAA
jgi:uncharacterized protein